MNYESCESETRVLLDAQDLTEALLNLRGIACELAALLKDTTSHYPDLNAEAISEAYISDFGLQGASRALARAYQYGEISYEPLRGPWRPHCLGSDELQMRLPETICLRAGLPDTSEKVSLRVRFDLGDHSGQIMEAGEQFRRLFQKAAPSRPAREENPARLREELTIWICLFPPRNLAGTLHTSYQEESLFRECQPCQTGMVVNLDQVAGTA